MKEKKPVLLYFLIIAILLSYDLKASGAGKYKSESGVKFVEVTDEAGIDFIHSFGDTNYSNMIESTGAGAAWLDYDQDGWYDLYIVTGKYYFGLSEGEKQQGDYYNHLYRNLGNGKFEDVTIKAGVMCRECYSFGVTVGDYDNNGWPDIYVANYRENVLYRNNGNGTFTDVTKPSGTGDPLCSVSAAWFDFDHDGFLDIYVGNYLDFEAGYKYYYSPDGFPGPLAYPAQPHTLYRNSGNGTFENVTQKMGITKKGRAMSVSAGDINNDGWDDIYVTNDATANFLYKNIEGRKFEEIAVKAHVAYNGMGDETASMGVDFGDYNGDGLIDILVSDNGFCSLYNNKGAGVFEDAAFSSGLARYSAQFVHWGTFFFDFDNDGDLDIFMANSDLSRLFGQEDQIFENIGNGQFRDVSLQMGAYFTKALMGRGAAYADYDNDGDLDIIIVNIAGKAVLLRNDGGNKNSALILKLTGKKSNRDGIGARVKVTAGRKVQIAEKRSAAGYLSQNDPRLFFGLGTGSKADIVEISWPSGKVQILKDVPAGKTVSIEEPLK